MAARKSGADASNSGPVSYLEDVPFKVNEKFRCPAKVGLPVGFCLPDTSLLLSTQYDFSLERRSVRWGVELVEARAAQARAEEAAAQRRSQNSPGEEPPATADERPPPPALNPVLAALSHDAILTPLPAPGPRLPKPLLPAPRSLDLTDFEREEDPFDKLELKTLDDKEELRSILQSQPPPAPPPSPPANANKPLPHKPNGLVSLLHEERPCNIRSLSFPKLSDSELPAADTANSAITANSANVANTAPAASTISPPSLPPTNGSPHRTPRGGAIVPTEPSKTTPTKPVNPVHCGSGLPCGGALLSMTPGERQCVETLVGMGYSYEGVLRAMQRQGQNVEQVLDYLFVHARLCERGFDSTAVEECLEMYHCSEEKALRFLQLMSRFGEMGFEREAIKEVLLFHNNDQDKALEELMSRAAAS